MSILDPKPKLEVYQYILKQKKNSNINQTLSNSGLKKDQVATILLRLQSVVLPISHVYGFEL